MQQGVQNCKKKFLTVLSIEKECVLAILIFCKLFNYFILYSLSHSLLGASYLKPTSERPLFRSGLFLECLSVFLDERWGGGAVLVLDMLFLAYFAI